MDRIKARDVASGRVIVPGRDRIVLPVAHLVHHWRCYDLNKAGKSGNAPLVWEDGFHNTVMDVGLTDLLEKYFRGSSYTAAWYFGLVNNSPAPTYAEGDTMSSHSGWTEFTDYSESTRVAPVFGNAAAAKTLTTSADSVFTITGGAATLDGLFLTTGSAKGGTTGILYSAGSFDTGDKVVDTGYQMRGQISIVFDQA